MADKQRISYVPLDQMDDEMRAHRSISARISSSIWSRGT